MQDDFGARLAVVEQQAARIDRIVDRIPERLAVIEAAMKDLSADVQRTTAWAENDRQARRATTVALIVAGLACLATIVAAIVPVLFGGHP
ncbi:MAG: hypothetical protein QM679_12435 [Patulibacter sp.]